MTVFNPFNRQVEQKRLDIQYLRGFAVVLVLLYHLAPDNFPGGYLGVDLFFVISGFVMAPQLYKLSNVSNSAILFEFKLFFLRRFWRLIPALSFVLVLLGVLIFFTVDTAELGTTLKQLLLASLGLANLGAYALSGDYFAPHGNAFLHLWSLSVELQIYLVMPIIFVIAGKVMKRFKLGDFIVLLTITAFSLAVFCVGSLLSDLSLLFGVNDSYQHLWYYLPITRVWEFTLGLLAWRLRIQFRGRFLSNVLIILFSIYTLYSLFTSSVNPKISIIIFDLLIFMYLISDYQASRLSRKFIFAKIGDASYSIYLVHLPVFFVFKYSTDVSSFMPGWLFYSLSFLAAIFLGIILYYLVEQKVGFVRAQSMRPRVRITVGLAITILPISLFSALVLNIEGIYRYTGFPQGAAGATWVWDKECEFYLTSNSKPAEVCDYSNPQSKVKVLLVGDSHAAVLSEDFVRMSKDLRFGAYVSTFEGCPFVLSLRDLQKMSTNPQEECLTHNQKILDWVKRERPTIIVYTHRGPLGYTGFGRQASVREFETVIHRNFTELSKLAQEVVLISSVPEWKSFSILDTLLRTSREVNPLSLPDLNLYRKEFNSNVSIVNSFDIFCKPLKCSTSLNGNNLYRDPNHLSASGSQLVNLRLKILLENLLE